MPGASFDFTPTTGAAFILFIGILIFVHELGHFLAAKYFGIKVEKFSLGFGPPIFRYQRGDTTYQVALLPLGGFVKMLGDNPGEEIPPEDAARAFNNVPVHHRAIVASAGPFFNLVFPIVCFFAFYLLVPTVPAPVVGDVEIGTPAHGAGLVTGDRVLEINGTRVWGFSHMVELVSPYAGVPIDFKIQRGEEVFGRTIVPREHPDRDIFGQKKTRGIIGVSPARKGRTAVGLVDPRARAFGFRTGDRVVAVEGKPIAWLSEFDAWIMKHRGQQLQVTVARPQSRRAGDLLFATFEEPVRLSIDVPPAATGAGDLGLASAEAFIRSVSPGGAAEAAGLQAGDQILSVNGKRSSLFSSIYMEIVGAEAQPVEVEIQRDAQIQTLTLVNHKTEILHGVTGTMQPRYDPGFGLGTAPRAPSTMYWNSGGAYVTERASLDVGQAFVASVRQTGTVIGRVTQAVFKLFIGEVSLKTVGGPIALFQVAAMAAEEGLLAYLELLAVISVNLGILNLLPLPVFDGGHLVFCAIEAVKRKPVSHRARETATLVGLLLLAVLVVFVFSNDISRISGGLFQ